jgi:pimeloyl-ACP methyl ester carboxylesterase
VWQRFVRRPWEGDFGLDELAAAPFPKLVISGGHGQAFEDICDAIAARLSAERAVITGAGHSVQRTGAPFNEQLEAFLRQATRASTKTPSR